MNNTEIKINHPIFKDVPEEVIVAFVSIRDLAKSQADFDLELFEILDQAIENIPLFETIADEELLDLTSVLIERKDGTFRIKK